MGGGLEQGIMMRYGLMILHKIQGFFLLAFVVHYKIVQFKQIDKNN
jgi:hypothetical protein